MLQLTGVEAGYDLLQVLWGVDLHVDEGEFVALLGPERRGQDDDAAHDRRLPAADPRFDHVPRQAARRRVRRTW